jgi:pre-mRNA-processing factor 6
MLARAVECVPHSVDMWLALARLETYENARRVLNSARKALPSEVGIWIAAARLEEGQNNFETVNKIVEKAVKILSGENSDGVVKRDGWLKEAEGCERAGASETAGAIVRNSIGLGVEDEDRLRTWVGDAEAVLERGSIETGRAVLAYALTVFAKKKSLWMKAVDLEKEHGSKEQLEATLKKAVKSVPGVEVLWLMLAKEKWVGGGVGEAREILTEAFAANPNSEQVWLAASKLEWEEGEWERARVLLARARERASTERVWMKSALLEREVGDSAEALRLIREGVAKFPMFSKYYMMAGQICYEDMKNVAGAREWYGKGLAVNDKSAELWILASRLEEVAGGGGSKARSLLELARLKNKANEKLWLEAIRLERRCGNEKGVMVCTSKGFQECPKSGILWAEAIENAERADQKGKSTDAIKNCGDDVSVIVAVAGLFINERKWEKARKWFHRAVTLRPDFGDAWVKWYGFEKDVEGGKNCAEVKERCVKAEPSKGEIWNAVAKLTGDRRKGVGEKLELCWVKLVREKKEKAEKATV